jgi:universal stress protein E
MRTRIKRILVAVKDPDHAPRAQLRKAATLARASGAVLEIFHAIAQNEIDDEVRGREIPETTAELIQALNAQALRRLQRLARAAVFAGLRVEVTPSWDFPPHEAVIRRAVSTNADLIVAAAQPQQFAGRLVLANTDWELIRHSPVPVLIVKSERDYRKPAVIAAIDPFHARAKPTRLDARILATASALGRLLKGATHSFHAYMPLVAMAPGPSGMPLMLPPELEDVHGEQVDKRFRRACERAHIPPARRHLNMGLEGDELSSVVKRLDAGIVVMGAVSRSGLRRVFIGNTAERILDDLGCDVLVVKPADFKSQVSRRRAHRQPVYFAPV